MRMTDRARPQEAHVWETVNTSKRLIHSIQEGIALVPAAWWRDLAGVRRYLPG